MSDEQEQRDVRAYMPTAEQIATALAGVRSTDDFFGQEGVFSRLFSEALQQMLEGEMSDHLGYERYEAKGRNSGNSRNGSYAKKVRTSTRESTLQVPRDRQRVTVRFLGRNVSHHNQWVRIRRRATTDSR